uniref:Uncharacterized protein n=1 Tax=Timema poppense TaxID=170557 RepID=A0A7R9DC05_TIMPO|nr:unnamed protein product [Timema poppensis]
MQFNRVTLVVAFVSQRPKRQTRSYPGRTWGRCRWRQAPSQPLAPSQTPKDCRCLRQQPARRSGLSTGNNSSTERSCIVSICGNYSYLSIQSAAQIEPAAVGEDSEDLLVLLVVSRGRCDGQVVGREESVGETGVVASVQIHGSDLDHLRIERSGSETGVKLSLARTNEELLEIRSGSGMEKKQPRLMA